MARPTKYSEEMLKQAQDYLHNHEDHEDVVPTAVGLAFLLDVSDKTLENWGKKHPEFLRTLERIQQKQHKGLVSGSLVGEFNPAISKLMLHNHGYSDKSEVDSNVKLTVPKIVDDVK